MPQRAEYSLMATFVFKHEASSYCSTYSHMVPQFGRSPHPISFKPLLKHVSALREKHDVHLVQLNFPTHSARKQATLIKISFLDYRLAWGMTSSVMTRCYVLQRADKMDTITTKQRRPTCRELRHNKSFQKTACWCSRF